MIEAAALAKLPRWPFGDSPGLADRLAALIVAGVKTGTCMAKSSGDMSTPGEKGVLVNGEEKPVALLEILTSEEMRFCEVTPELAALEGEGDLSFEYWKTAHQNFFERTCGFSEDMEIVFETFRVLEILDHEFAEQADAHLRAERAGKTI